MIIAKAITGAAGQAGSRRPDRARCPHYAGTVASEPVTHRRSGTGDVAADSDTADRRDADSRRLPAAMRRDVRLLGEILGQVISEDAGEDLLADVEDLRHRVIAARRDEAGPDADDDIAALVAGWPLGRAEAVARAFTVYFHLANLAEEHQRIRTLRERDAGGEPVRDSLAAAVAGLRRMPLGVSHQDALIGRLEVHPVLTAHPTEARRRAVTESLRRISAQLDVLDSPQPGAAAQAEAMRRLREEIDLLWRTSALRSRAMQPLDEVRSGMAVFDDTLFRLAPAVYRALDRAIQGDASGAVPPRAPAFLRFGSWIGADRDGNPFVTAAVTEQTARIQADHALRALENATTRIGRSLTIDAALAGGPVMKSEGPGAATAAAELAAALAVAADQHPALLGELSSHAPGEPFRTFLLYAAERLLATRTGQGDAGLRYRAAAEYVADLRLAQRALAAVGAARQAFGELQHLIWQAETFGFHLAELEVRQHSAVHAKALRELRAGGDASAQTQEVLATFAAIAAIQRRHGPEACRRYVVSFTTSAADIAAVHELAELACPGGAPVLDIVPLFESGADLANASAVLDGMIALKPVARRLAVTGRRLEVMLGYSDSAKELGMVSATLRLYDTQARLVRWARARDITLVLFHGRGGALGRGGGPAGRAVLAQAPGSVDGRFKVTEQGEVIFARYGRSAIGLRHLEQVTSAVLLASSPSVAARNRTAATAFRALATEIDDAARRAFRALVETEGFAEWFARVSPLEEISGLRIGSRPSRRGLGGGPLGLEDLRAIPWVFAWAQTRLNLPGWYGLGSGLAAAAWSGVAAGDSDEGLPIEGLTALRRAYSAWPLLATLLDNAEMSLAKTDRAIAARYLAFGGRQDLTDRVLAEYDLTRRLVLAVTGHDRLLADRRVLSRAIVLRDPYVDALSYLQLRALSALRADQAPEDADSDERLLLLTVSGIAAGLQNTG
jgi:phosphoenolpyruvate carboxylase